MSGRWLVGWRADILRRPKCFSPGRAGHLYPKEKVDKIAPGLAVHYDIIGTASIYNSRPANGEQEQYNSSTGELRIRMACKAHDKKLLQKVVFQVEGCTQQGRQVEEEFAWIWQRHWVRPHAWLTVSWYSGRLNCIKNLMSEDTIITVPLHSVAHSRAGDKDNRLDLSFISYEKAA